jgi:hypothetical protein
VPRHRLGVTNSTFGHFRKYSKIQGLLCVHFGLPQGVKTNAGRSSDAHNGLCSDLTLLALCNHILFDIALTALKSSAFLLSGFRADCSSLSKSI